MTQIESERLDPHRRERRERIATAVLAALVGRAGAFEPSQLDAAMQAADQLIAALDTEPA